MSGGELENHHIANTYYFFVHRSSRLQSVRCFVYYVYCIKDRNTIKIIIIGAEQTVDPMLNIFTFLPFDYHVHYLYFIISPVIFQFSYPLIFAFHDFVQRRDLRLQRYLILLVLLLRMTEYENSRRYIEHDRVR